MTIHATFLNVTGKKDQQIYSESDSDIDEPVQRKKQKGITPQYCKTRKKCFWHNLAQLHLHDVKYCECVSFQVYNILQKLTFQQLNVNLIFHIIECVRYTCNYNLANFLSYMYVCKVCENQIKKFSNVLLFDKKRMSYGERFIQCNYELQ